MICFLACARVRDRSGMALAYPKPFTKSLKIYPVLFDLDPNDKECINTLAWALPDTLVLFSMCTSYRWQR